MRRFLRKIPKILHRLSVTIATERFHKSGDDLSRGNSFMANKRKKEFVAIDIFEGSKFDDTTKELVKRVFDIVRKEGLIRDNEQCTRKIYES